MSGMRSPLRVRFGFSRIGGRVHAPLPTVSATGATETDGSPACDSRRPSPAPPYVRNGRTLTEREPHDRETGFVPSALSPAADSEVGASPRRCEPVVLGAAGTVPGSRSVSVPAAFWRGLGFALPLALAFWLVVAYLAWLAA